MRAARAPAIGGGGRGRRPAEEVEEAVGAHLDGRGAAGRIGLGGAGGCCGGARGNL